MPKLNPLRPLTMQEQEELERIARSRTEAIRRVERARIILALADGQKASEVALQFKVCEASVHYRRKRFNEAGLAGLDDLARSGRPETYDERQRGQMVLTAKTNPQQVGMSFGHWTLDRLVEYVNGRLHIAISRSQLADVLKQEGLKWYQEKTYFTDSPTHSLSRKGGDCEPVSKPTCSHSHHLCG